MKIVSRNKRARFDYFLEKTVTAGIVLTGTEVKAVREGRVNMDGSYVRIMKGEAYVYDMFIGDYSKAPPGSHDPMRRRKLLLHKREIRKLQGRVQEKGVTLVPVTMFFSDRNLVKMEVAVARGKTKQDKRETIKKREAERRIRETLR